MKIASESSCLLKSANECWLRKLKILCFYVEHAWTSVWTGFTMLHWLTVECDSECEVKFSASEVSVIPVKWQCSEQWKWSEVIVQQESKVSGQWCVSAVKLYLVNTDAFTYIIITQTVSDCFKLHFKWPIYTFF